MANDTSEIRNKIDELVQAIMNTIYEKLSRQSLDVVPEFVGLLTAKMESSVSQRRLVLTALYRDFRGKDNAGKAPDIVKSIHRLFPETAKRVWPETDMGISVGQVLRWLREELPANVIHFEYDNSETHAKEHLYYFA